VTWYSPGARPKPTLDEDSFQQLLAAAYVVQQHHDSLRTEGLPSGNSQVLSAITEIQGLIRTRNLNVAAAANLIADRLLIITRAAGVSISLITEGYLDCVAEAGRASKVPGSCVASHSLVATERLKAGGIFESEDAQTDIRLDIGLCRAVGVGALLAAPILCFGEIAGLIEVRWEKAGGFGDADRRTCQLMAGLTAGTIERSVRLGNTPAFRTDNRIAPTAVGSDRAALEPVLAASALEPSAEIRATTAKVSDKSEHTPEALPKSAPEAGLKPDAPLLPEERPNCRVCGRPFAANEAFCGFCSMPRVSANPPHPLQSKWASLWFMQRAQGAFEEIAPATPAKAEKRELAPSPPAPRVSNQPENSARLNGFTRARHPRPEAMETPVSVGYTTPIRKRLPYEDRPPRAFWKRTLLVAKKRWRDAFLTAVAFSLAAALISAWPRSDTQLTWFQSLMVRLGVTRRSAPAPVYVGRPDARVWLDVHTTLYYCEGSDLYGKTPDGNFTTQHDAQRTGFEPASRTACP
jgi:hypothetical protein